MVIGIDISQIVYEGTGVSRYVRQMVTELVSLPGENTFVLFGASLRKRKVFRTFVASLPHGASIRLVTVPIPPTLLHILWNVLHIVPAEVFVGDVDIYWSSDWTQPPLRTAVGVTTVHDVTPLLFPKEHDSRIVHTHRRRLERVRRVCRHIFCDSLATKQDCRTVLGIPEQMMTVVYPGISV